MFQTKVVDKIKIHILYSIHFFRKSCRLWDNVKKYGRASQATDGSIIRRMLFACRITKATDTHSEYVVLVALPQQQWVRERSSILRLYSQCLSYLWLVTYLYPYCRESSRPVHRHIAARSDTQKTQYDNAHPLLRLIVHSYDHVARESKQMHSFIAAVLSFITRHVLPVSRTPLHFEFSVSYFIAIFLVLHRTLYCLWPFYWQYCGYKHIQCIKSCESV
jgi:hypothetical protein